jgi:hypothetical protein
MAAPRRMRGEVLNPEHVLAGTVLAADATSCAAPQFARKKPALASLQASPGRRVLGAIWTPLVLPGQSDWPASPRRLRRRLAL